METLRVFTANIYLLLKVIALSSENSMRP